MSEVMAVPEHLKKYMAQPSSDADSMATASISVPRISLRARKFRFNCDGEETVAGEEIHVVILGVDPPAGAMIKTFYDGAYNPDDSSPPDCSSSNGLQPDAWVSTPQSNLCASCPKNAFGSATSQSGKKSKACRDAKRLWVAKPDDVDGTVYGLNVPVTSLKNLSAYGAQIKKMGIPTSSIITKLTMADTDFPILEFAVLGFLNEETFLIANKRHEEQDWRAPKVERPAVEQRAQPRQIEQSAMSKGAEQHVDSQAAAAQTVEARAESSDVDDVLNEW